MTPGKPKLSLVVPVSGDSNRIKRFGSWFESSGLISIEVIIVEDNLRIETQLELERQLSDFPREISVARIAGNFGNPGDARNAGLAKITGEWVAFWDSDDLPNLAVVEEILIEPESRVADFIYADFLISNDASKKTSQNKFASRISSVDLSLVALEPGIWRFVFKRNILGSTRFPPFKMGEDQLFISRLELHNRKGRYVKKNIYTYFRGQLGQLTENINRVKYLESSLSEHFLLLKMRPSKFVKLVVLRQSITLIAKGNYSLKFTGLKFLVKAIFLHRSWHEFTYILSKSTWNGG
jgi:glycosyltransferase involved in cell wall biosynthesis